MKTKTSNHKPTHEEIARRAYAIFEASGKVSGRDVQNWLQAERELKGSSQESEAKAPNNNGRAATPKPMVPARGGESRLERKYA